MPETTGSKFLKGMFLSLVNSFIHHTSIYLNTYYMLGMLPCAENIIEREKKKKKGEIPTPKELAI